MKERSFRLIKLFYRVSAWFFCACFLSGCAAVPVQRTSSYFEDLYKRISYKTEGNYRVINVFYATSRETYADKENQVRFSRKIGSGLTCGELHVKLDPRIKIGKMLPKRFKRRGEIGIQDISRLESEAFMKELTDAVAKSPHKSLLVLVFGFKDDFESTAMKAAYFAYLLDVNTPVLLFDWPGDQMISIAGYNKAQSYARASGPYLGELLTKIIREVKPDDLWIEASSMGCQVVCDSFDHMIKHDDLKDIDHEISHIFFAAPDVGEDEFDHHFKDQLSVLSKNLTTYVASNDTALLISGLINEDERLGRQKMKVEEQEQLEETKDMLYLKTMAPDKIALIDVTPINKASYGHGYYLEDPEFYDDVYLRMFGNQPQANRRLYLLKYKGDTDYWVLKGGD